MVDEKDGISSAGGEEEYHFTDENTDYEMGSAASTETVATAPAKSFAVRIQESRRILMGVFVFLMLLGVVYRMLVPGGSSSRAPADIIQNVSSSPKKASAVQNTPTSVERASAADVTSAPIASPIPDATVAPLDAATALVSAPSEHAAQPAGTEDQSSALANRVSSIEQQNTTFLHTLQTKYMQRISDIELQNSQMRLQMQDLKAQLEDVKQAFHQLSLLLQKEASASNTLASPSEAAAAPGSNTVKSSKDTGYSVQAIIPGRAWLKSDSGDTVTVAEGDTLRGVGRVVRIDPYDGIVNLDTGHKVITLSYGMGADE